MFECHGARCGTEDFCCTGDTHTKQEQISVKIGQKWKSASFGGLVWWRRAVHQNCFCSSAYGSAAPEFFAKMFATENLFSKSQIKGGNDQIRAGKLEGTRINTLGTRSLEQNHLKRAKSRDQSKANLGQYFWYFQNCKEKFGGFGGWVESVATLGSDTT